MSMEIFNTVQTLTDDELHARVEALAARERGTIAELIAHLAELEARELHLAAGYGSMFAYCHEALRLSEHEALNRIEVARAARRFPVILDLLTEGAVHLTAVRLLAPHLTAENHAQVLESARGLRKAEIETLVARLAPKPDVPVSVRKLPASSQPASSRPEPSQPGPQPTATHGAAPWLMGAAQVPTAPAPASSPGAHGVSVGPTPRASVVTALSPDRYKLQLTIGGDTLEKLRRAKDLLRRANPSGDEAAIIDRALTLLLADLAKKKLAASSRPRPARGEATRAEPARSESRHIPADVKRAVCARDLGRCAFVGANGRRCNERAFVEFHHVRPYAEGGPPTIPNIELRCRCHNAYEWRRRVHDVRVLEDEWHRRRLEGTVAHKQPQPSGAP